MIFVQSLITVIKDTKIIFLFPWSLLDPSSDLSVTVLLEASTPMVNLPDKWLHIAVVQEYTKIASWDKKGVET